MCGPTGHSPSLTLLTGVIVCAITVATCPVPVVALGIVSPQTPTQYLDYVTVTCDLLGVNPRQLQSRCMWDETTLSYIVDTSLLRCDISGTLTVVSVSYTHLRAHET